MTTNADPNELLRFCEKLLQTLALLILFGSLIPMSFIGMGMVPPKNT